MAILKSGSICQECSCCPSSHPGGQGGARAADRRGGLAGGADRLVAPVRAGDRSLHGAHHWAPLFMAQGAHGSAHGAQVRRTVLVVGRARQNDAADAAAICEAQSAQHSTISSTERRAIEDALTGQTGSR